MNNGKESTIKTLTRERDIALTKERETLTHNIENSHKRRVKRRTKVMRGENERRWEEKRG